MAVYSGCSCSDERLVLYNPKAQVMGVLSIYDTPFVLEVKSPTPWLDLHIKR